MSLTLLVEPDGKRDVIRKDLVDAIRDNASSLSKQEWIKASEKHGFVVEYFSKVPMYLLHPKHLIEDKVVLGVVKIVKNRAINLKARKRVLKIR